MTNQTSQRWTMLAYALAIIAGVGNGLWGTEGLLAVADHRRFDHCDFVSNFAIERFGTNLYSYALLYDSDDRVVRSCCSIALCDHCSE